MRDLPWSVPIFLDVFVYAFISSAALIKIRHFKQNKDRRNKLPLRS